MNFKIGICQLAVINDKLQNINKAKAMISEAKQQGCHMAILPEMFNCPYQSEYFSEYAESYLEGQTIEALKQSAIENKMIIIGGSIPEKADDKIYNTCFIFDANGVLLGRHRKVHLFDVELEGGTVFKESNTLAAGNDITVISVGKLNFGVAICYDIRFPELLRAMTLKGAQILIFPAVFGPTTGPAHWELLMRSRAVDNQVYVIGAAPALTPCAEYQAYGHSMVVDPWGNIIGKLNNKEDLLVVELNLDMIAKVRQQLPLLKHRRTDIYK